MPASSAADRQPMGVKPNTRMPPAISHLANGGWAGEDSTPWRRRSAASSA